MPKNCRPYVTPRRLKVQAGQEAERVDPASGPYPRAVGGEAPARAG